MRRVHSSRSFTPSRRAPLRPAVQAPGGQQGSGPAQDAARYLAAHQGGSGFASDAADLFRSPLSGETSSRLSNAYQRHVVHNPDFRDTMPGEQHLWLPTKYGLTRANWAGPGTRTDVRIPRNDPGVDGPRGIDECAKRHDTAYVGARTASDVRGADNRFAACVAGSTQSAAIRAAVVAAFAGKRLAERTGLISPGKFVGHPIEGAGIGAGLRRMMAAKARGLRGKGKGRGKGARKRGRKQRGGYLAQAALLAAPIIFDALNTKGNRRTLSRGLKKVGHWAGL